MTRIFTHVWRKYGIIGMCFLVSIMLHVMALAVFGSYKLFRYIYPKDSSFEAAPFQKKAVQMRTIQHRVSLKKPPQNPRVIRRLAVNKLAQVSLPVMPQREAMSRKFEVSKDFLDGGAIGGDFNVAENIFGSVKQMDKAFEGKVYALAKDTGQLPKHWPAKALGTIYARQLNVPAQDFMIGFPGVSDRFEWFGIEYKGDFYIREPGTYCWKGSSDDGMKLIVDGNEILSIDGIHPETAATKKCKLREGKHTIKVKYFQGPGNAVALRLWIAPPSDTNDFRIFNMSDYPVPVDER